MAGPVMKPELLVESSFSAAFTEWLNTSYKERALLGGTVPGIGPYDPIGSLPTSKWKVLLFKRVRQESIESSSSTMQEKALNSITHLRIGESSYASAPSCELGLI